NYTFLGELSVEGGIWSTANMHMFQVPDCYLQATVLKLEGDATQKLRLLYTQGSGIIDVGLLRIGIEPSGSGDVYCWHVGGTLNDPTAEVGRVSIGDVAFYGDVEETRWSRSGLDILPTHTS